MLHFRNDPRGLDRYRTMKPMTKLHLALWGTLIWGSAVAGPVGLFHEYRPADPLGRLVVSSVLQDREGFLWFGTDQGAARFDGRDLRWFTRREGLADDAVRVMHLGREGKLWVGTEKGLAVREGDRFRAVVDAAGRGLERVTALWTDPAGTLWVGCGDGVFLLRGDVPERWPLSGRLPHPFTYAILGDHAGRVWIGTLKGLACLRDGGLRVLTTADGLAGNDVMSLFEDSRRHLWVGTRKGVSRFDGHGFRTYGVSDGLASPLVFAITEDRRGNLWFGTVEGVSCFDGRRFSVFRTEVGIFANRVRSIFEDREGNLWFGTHEGARKFNGRLFTNYTRLDGLAHNWVFSLCQDPEGRMWFGTWRNGISRFDGARWRTFTTADGLPSDWVLSLLADRQGRFWAGTAAGPCLLEGERFRAFTGDGTLAEKTIFTLFEDSRRRIWFGTPEGAACLDGESVFRYNTRNGMPDNIVNTFAEDPQGRIWVGTDDGAVRIGPAGLELFNEGQGLSCDMVMSVAVDRKGRVWFGTPKGLFAFDGKAFTGYDRSNGLADPFVYSVLPGRNDELWLGTTRGVVHFVGGAFRKYTETDGMISSVLNQGAALRDREGRLWFGTTGGVTCLDPAWVNETRVPPPVYLTGLRLFDEDVEPRPGTRFPYDRNYLEFHFVGLDFSSPAEVRYQYTLEGLAGDKWQWTDRRAVAYQHLPPGEYRFVVQARNAAGLVSPVPATFAFAVLPPFWETWWFRALAAGLVLLVVLGGYEWRLRRVKARLRSRAERDLVRQRDETEKKLLQQEINLQEDFTAMLAHDLRNPLCVIQATLEMLMLESPDEQARHRARMGLQSVQLMLELIGDMLDLGRSGNGNLHLVRGEVSLREVLSTLLELAGPACEQKGLSLEVELPELPPVQGDALKLKRAMQNLLTNAVKFSPPGGRLRVSLEAVDDEGRAWQEFRVRDEGPGIAPEEETLLFRKYSQLKSGISQGSGLGLAIAKMVVEAHGGRVGFRRPTDGPGSIFFFRVPENSSGNSDQP